MHDCINCGSAEERTPVLDLGEQPLANGLLRRQYRSVPLHPLSISECVACHLVQLDEHVDPKYLFHPAYPYRQGTSKTWVEHLEAFVAGRTAPAGLRSLDVGANDGTLVDLLAAAGWDAWGHDIVPSDHPRVVLDGGPGPFHLVTAFNVLAHVPNLDFFIARLHSAMMPGRHLVIEVPDWDLVYHEHYSYFTEETLANVLGRRGFIPCAPFEKIDTHGGSIRAVVTHA